MEKPRSWLTIIGGVPTLIMGAVLITLLVGMLRQGAVGLNPIFLTAFVAALLLGALRIAAHAFSLTGTLITLLEILWWLALLWALFWAASYVVIWNGTS